MRLKIEGEIGDWDCGLGFEDWDCELGLESDIYRDWGPGCGIGTGDGYCKLDMRIGIKNLN